MKRFAQGVFVSLIVFMMTGGIGCSSNKKVATAHVTETHSSPSYGEETTKTTKVELEAEPDDDDNDDGGLFNIMGDIVALPFRALGAIF